MQDPGRHVLLGESADELHGRGGYRAAPQDIIAAVQAAGYGASLKGAGKASAERCRGGGRAGGSRNAEAEAPAALRRSVFLLVLMYFSMGHMMWGWPLPAFYTDNHVAMGLTQLLLTVAVMVINQKFFISGFQSLRRRAPNMDTLVALGVDGSPSCYSAYALFAMTGAQVRGDMDGRDDVSCMDFYFESAAMILTLITVGKMLEARSKGKHDRRAQGPDEAGAARPRLVERDGGELDGPHRAGAEGRHLRGPAR